MFHCNHFLNHFDYNNSNYVCIVICYQVFFSNTNNSYTIIWFKVTIPNNDNTLFASILF